MYNFLEKYARYIFHISHVFKDAITVFEEFLELFFCYGREKYKKYSKYLFHSDSTFDLLVSFD